MVNISFVVIAKNESFCIKKCLSGLEKIKIKDCEYVLVDSDSTDGTEQLMMGFYEVHAESTKVIRCSGTLNAAVVRNVGFSNSSGDIVFFVDGDTEINLDFVESAISRLEADLSVVAVTGKLSDVMYTDDFTTVLGERVDRNNIRFEQDVLTFGGNVCVRRSALEEAGGWCEDFMVNEDFELALRLSALGKIKAIPVYIGKHHTKRSAIFNRSISVLKALQPRFFGQLLRKHSLSFNNLKKCLSCNKGHSVGFLYFLGVCICLTFGWWFEINLLMLVLLFLVLLFDLLCGWLRGKGILDRIVLRILFPPVVVFGWFFPYRIRRNVISKKIS